MKRIFTLVAAIVLSANVWAQSPEKMSYQAVVRDANNTLVASQSVGMQISILQGSANGSPVYVETQTVTSNTGGLVSLEIGSGYVVTGDFSAIDWSTGVYFIKTETDPTGGSIYTITGTSQLMSVPYALHAKTAANGLTIDQADAIESNTAKNSEAPGTLSGEMKYWNGSAWVVIPAIQNEGATLQMIGGVPTWTGGTVPLPPVPAIGEDYLGGKLAYVLRPGDSGFDRNVPHGLIAAPTDQSTGILWHAINDGEIGTTDQAIGSGQANTAAIIALYGSENNAAKLCDDLVLNGYDDWFLPSLNELEQLYNNRVAIGGPFDAAAYWSSTESTTQYAYYFSFNVGLTSQFNKTNPYFVRAVRAF